MEQKAVKDMSVVELKALCYDLLAQREVNAQQIQQITALIQQKSRPEPISETRTE